MELQMLRLNLVVINIWLSTADRHRVTGLNYAPQARTSEACTIHTHTYGMTGNFLPYWFRRVDKLRITLRGRGNFAITILTRCSVQTCARVPTLNEWKSTSLLLSFTPVVRHSRGLRFDDRLKLRHRDLSWCRCPFPASSFFPGIERRVNFV